MLPLGLRIAFEPIDLSAKLTHTAKEGRRLGPSAALKWRDCLWPRGGFPFDAGETCGLDFDSLLATYHSNSIIEGSIVNKNDLIDEVANGSGLSKSDAAKAVEAVFDKITAALRNGDEVRLVGFGTFSVSNRAASEGRNPRTGEKIQIPASKQPKFKAGKGLKDAVN
jgi:DNA-binding protein HU-beta